MDDFRDISIDVLKQYFTGQLHKHRINVEILLENTVGVAEHPDIMETIEKELGVISEYEDKLAVLRKYFKSGWAAGKKKEVLNG